MKRESMRPTTGRSTLILAVLVMVFAGAVGAQGNLQQLLNTGWSNWTQIPSYLYGGPTVDLEAADDFDLNATISRVIMNGDNCFACAAPVLLGVYVRFYSGTGGQIGALQVEHFIPAGDPNFVYSAAAPATFDITLPTPFVATGRHFLSVQAVSQGIGAWYVWVANNNNATNSPVLVRDRLAGAPWTTHIAYPGASPTNADLSFQLWGPAPPPPPSTDPAGNWEYLTTPNLAGNPRAMLRDLKVLALDDVFAVGDALIPNLGNTENISVCMRWDGTQWNFIPIPSPTAAQGLTNCFVYCIDGTGPNDLWAAGTQKIQVNGGWVGQQVMIQHWNGTQWTVMANAPLPNTSLSGGVSGATVYDCAAISTNDVWFVGRWITLNPSGSTGRVGLLTRWDGSNFTQYDVPIVAPTGGQIFNAVSASASNDVWAVGQAENITSLPSAVPVIYHWNGSNWTHRPTPITAGTRVQFHEVVAIAPNDVYVVGFTQVGLTGPLVPAMYHWNGSTWAAMPAPTNQGQLQVLSPNLIYSIRADVQRFNGTSWSTVATFPTVTSAQGLGVDTYGAFEFWTAGFEWVGGVPRPFTARVDGPRYSDTTVRSACSAFGAPGTLLPLSQPKPGTTFSVGIADSAGWLGTAGGQAQTYWFLALSEIAGNCGLLVGGGGANGAPGEVLIDPASIFYVNGPVPVAGATLNAVHSLAIPPLPSLAGATVATQAVLVNPLNPSQLLLTNELKIRIGY